MVKQNHLEEQNNLHIIPLNPPKHHCFSLQTHFIYQSNLGLWQFWT
jgi:hypothetical protein